MFLKIVRDYLLKSDFIVFSVFTGSVFFQHLFGNKSSKNQTIDLRWIQ
jgi:hypothetical protein